MQCSHQLLKIQRSVLKAHLITLAIKYIHDKESNHLYKSSNNYYTETVGGGGGEAGTSKELDMKSMGGTEVLSKQ